MKLAAENSDISRFSKLQEIGKKRSAEAYLFRLSPSFDKKLIDIIASCNAESEIFC